MKRFWGVQVIKGLGCVTCGALLFFAACGDVAPYDSPAVRVNGVVWELKAPLCEISAALGGPPTYSLCIDFETLGGGAAAGKISFCVQDPNNSESNLWTQGEHAATGGGGDSIDDHLRSIGYSLHGLTADQLSVVWETPDAQAGHAGKMGYIAIKKSINIYNDSTDYAPAIDSENSKQRDASQKTIRIDDPTTGPPAFGNEYPEQRIYFRCRS